MSGRCSNATRQLLWLRRGQFTSNSGNGDSSALRHYKSRSMKAWSRLCPVVITLVSFYTLTARRGHRAACEGRILPSGHDGRRLHPNWPKPNRDRLFSMCATLQPQTHKPLNLCVFIVEVRISCWSLFTWN